jgi:hypothetical protein
MRATPTPDTFPPALSSALVATATFVCAQSDAGDDGPAVQHTEVTLHNRYDGNQYRLRIQVWECDPQTILLALNINCAGETLNRPHEAWLHQVMSHVFGEAVECLGLQGGPQGTWSRFRFQRSHFATV